MTELSWHDWNSARDISRDGQFVLFEDASEAAGPNYAVVLRKVDGTLPIRLGEGSCAEASRPTESGQSRSPRVTSPQVTLLPIGAGQPRTRSTSAASTHSEWLVSLSSGWAKDHRERQRSRSRARVLCSGFPAEKPKLLPRKVFVRPIVAGRPFVVGKSLSRVDPALYPVDGGPPRSHSGPGPSFKPVQWSSDGTSSTATSRAKFPSKIYKVEIAHGKETVLQELRPGTPAGVVTVAPVVVSRDGTHFAYSYNQNPVGSVPHLRLALVARTSFSPAIPQSPPRHSERRLTSTFARSPSRSR